MSSCDGGMHRTIRKVAQHNLFSRRKKRKKRAKEKGGKELSTTHKERYDLERVFKNGFRQDPSMSGPVKRRLEGERRDR